ncbi:ribonuclease HI family protein [Candidatus Daviesbacteria bacterium]|nr:ribonuclease HI family protein [Candidatus Daviesbacteria bacterium]
MKIIVYTDGASRGNPGEASYGFTISDENRKFLYEEGKFIGIATNNVAEYTAVLEALKYIKRKFAGSNQLSIELYADSKLVVEQLSGRYKMKSPHLKPLFEQIKILAMELGGVVHTHVPRSRNSAADRLANLALDSR